MSTSQNRDHGQVPRSITTPDVVQSRIGRLEFADGVAEGNWVQTEPGKGWFQLLRFYSPLPAFFDKTWRAGEIELVE